MREFLAQKYKEVIFGPSSKELLRCEAIEGHTIFYGAAHKRGVDYTDLDEALKRWHEDGMVDESVKKWEKEVLQGNNQE